MSDTETIWMRCLYDADLCGADAELSDYETHSDDSWTGRLECVNGHIFEIRQEAIREEANDS